MGNTYDLHLIHSGGFMGILNNTVSISQFQIIGTKHNEDFINWVGEGLSKNRFRSIEHTSEELSFGWVQTGSSTGTFLSNGDSVYSL